MRDGHFRLNPLSSHVIPELPGRTQPSGILAQYMLTPAILAPGILAPGILALCILALCILAPIKTANGDSCMDVVQERTGDRSSYWLCNPPRFYEMIWHDFMTTSPVITMPDMPPVYMPVTDVQDPVQVPLPPPPNPPHPHSAPHKPERNAPPPVQDTRPKTASEPTRHTMLVSGSLSRDGVITLADTQLSSDGPRPEQTGFILHAADSAFIMEHTALWMPLNLDLISTPRIEAGFPLMIHCNCDNALTAFEGTAQLDLVVDELSGQLEFHALDAIHGTELTGMVDFLPVLQNGTLLRDQDAIFHITLDAETAQWHGDIILGLLGSSDTPDAAGIFAAMHQQLPDSLIGYFGTSCDVGLPSCGGAN